MTPDALRTLARAAQTTSEELDKKRDEACVKGGNGAVTVATCYAACAAAFMTFARVLAEAANAEAD